MNEEKKRTRWLSWLAFAILLILIYKMLDNFTGILDWTKKLVSILMPFIIGLILSYLLYIPCRQLEKVLSMTKMSKKLARLMSVITVYILSILLITFVINIIIPIISKSIGELAQNLPGYYNTAKEYINTMPENSIIKKESAQEIISSLEKIDVTKIINTANIMEYIKGVMGIAKGIFSIFVTIIMSIYILLERAQIVKFIKKLNTAMFKEKTCNKINKYFVDANNIFFKFISTQILDAIIVGALSSIILMILKVKYALLLGIIIGIFNIIPYFGAFIGITIACIITLFTGGLGKTIWMLIIIVIIQQIDANIINPRLLGNSLKLSPILVVFSVTIFRSVLGCLRNVFSSSNSISYKTTFH